MRLVIAGSRRLCQQLLFNQLIKDALEYWDIFDPSSVISEVLSGACPVGGADSLGEDWAECNWIPVRRFQPKDYGMGKARFHRRNEAMSLAGERAIIAMACPPSGAHLCLDEGHEWNRGSRSLLRYRKRHQKHTLVYAVDESKRSFSLLSEVEAGPKQWSLLDGLI